MEKFYRFVRSIFPVTNVACGRPHDQSFDMDLNGEYMNLIFYSMQPGDVMRLGKARLKKIWDNIGKWDAAAFDILRGQYEGDASEDLALTILEIYYDGGFALGYRVADDGDNLHLFVDFNRDFIPSRETSAETY